jgi:hypothetical protein
LAPPFQQRRRREPYLRLIVRFPLRPYLRIFLLEALRLEALRLEALRREALRRETLRLEAFAILK